MPQVVRKDIDNLNVSLTVTIEKSDYEQNFRQELDKHRKKAQLKGFRKGKTPTSVIRKFYGKPILADLVEKLLQKELGDFLTREKLETLGYPLASEDQDLHDLDTLELSDLEFKFDLGVAPQFELQGISPNDEYELLVIEIPESDIDAEMENLRERNGQQVLVETDIQPNDILRLQVKELEDGTVKENGHTHEFEILADRLEAGIKSEFLNRKSGDTIEVDLFQLEEETTEDFVRKHFLGLEEDDDKPVGNRYEATILEVKRFEKAGLDTESLQKIFGEEVTTEEQARSFMREDIGRYYRSQADVVFYRKAQDALIAKNDLPLPDEFLKRWLKADMKNPKPHDFEHQYYHFAENLRWTLIREKLMDRLGVTVTDAQILAIYKNRFRQYLQDETILDTLAQRFMENDREKGNNEVFEEAVAAAITVALKEQVKLVERPVSAEEFNAIRTELSGHHHHHHHEHSHDEEE